MSEPPITGSTHTTAAGPESLRDRFAMAALTGMLAQAFMTEPRRYMKPNMDPYDFAQSAYEQADAMMNERKIIKPGGK